MLHAPGKVEFKASKKELAGAVSGNNKLLEMPRFQQFSLNLPTEQSISLDCYDVFHNVDLGQVEFMAKLADGKVIRGNLNNAGKTKRIYTDAESAIEVLVGAAGAWGLIGDDGDCRSNSGEAHHDEEDEDEN